MVGAVANTFCRALGDTQTRTVGERTPATGNEVVEHTVMFPRPPPMGPVACRHSVGTLMLQGSPRPTRDKDATLNV